MNDLKKEFPIFSNLKNFIYLDSCATTQKPQSVLDVVKHFYEFENANVHRSLNDFANSATIAYENARQKTASFLGAKKEEIIFTKGVTASINHIANAFAKNFKQIIISEIEHHSNILPYLAQRRTQGNELQIARVNENLQLNLEYFERLVQKHPQSFVSLVHISNAFGVEQPIKEAAQIAKKYGCTVLVDGAQAAPHITIDVKDLDIDFYAISGHKCYGPTGIGALYINENIFSEVPPFEVGGGAINHVSFKGVKYLPAPYCYEGGTPNIAGAIGMAQALEFYAQNKDQVREKELIKQLKNALKDIKDIQFYTQLDTKGCLSFNIKDVGTSDLGILLSKQNIFIRTGHHCTMPIMEKLNIKGTARVSLGLYSNKEDIQKFIVGLNKALKMLKD